MKNSYDKDTKLDFGMYKGYDLGVVYIFDPLYVDWCINHIDDFFISDIWVYRNFGIVTKNIDWQVRQIGDPSLIPFIDMFDTFQEFCDETDLGDQRYSFSGNTVRKNLEKGV
jgi:hypothetical protein